MTKRVRRLSWAVAGMLIATAASAEDVEVFTRAGSVVRGKLLSITQESVLFDPEGPVAFRRLPLVEVDSVLVLGRRPRRLYPPPAGQVLIPMPMSRNRPTSRTGRFGLSGYVSRRLSTEFDRGTGTDQNGQPIGYSMNMDGGTGAGLVGEWLKPNTIGFGTFFVDLGLYHEALSIVLPGVSAEFANLNYFEMTGGFKLMIDLRHSSPRLLVSPLVGVGCLLTNPTRVSDIYSPYYGRVFPDANLCGYVGLALDLLSRSGLGLSLEGRYTRAQYFLEVDSFAAPQVRLALMKVASE
jgi:hypothetical protein